MTACSSTGTSTKTSTGTSASEGSQPAAMDAAAIVSRFQDSSVPPQYHRSEELTIDRATTRLVIDSYGDVLADESRPTPPDLWRELVAGIDSMASIAVEPSQEGCVGGTSTSLRVTSAGQVIIDIRADECAGSNAQASEAIGEWIGPARRLFPATEALAPTR